MSPPASTPAVESRCPEACAIVVFGAFGDLTKRLVVPALYNLEARDELPEGLRLIGTDLVEADAETWRTHLHDMLHALAGDPTSEFNVDTLDESIWARLARRMDYISGDMTKAPAYSALAERLAAQGFAQGNVIFYLAVADRFFATVVDALGTAGLTREGEGYWRRVVVEKPFGHDLASARALNRQLRRTLAEDQIFRIDHFLGKETVQSIMALRFANGLFEPIWNRDRIDHVQITAAEVVGVEGRGKFYEATGALRDMVPNHLFSLLAMIAMEPPATFDAKGIRDRKADVFAAMPPLDPADVVRGQYDAGTVRGEKVKAYREEANVDASSKVETYVALRAAIDSWRWAGVPFFLRTGKHLAEHVTEIAIRFKPAPVRPFQPAGVDLLSANWLVIHIQPSEGMSLQFEVKQPGAAFQLSTVRMSFSYGDWFGHVSNVGYETLIYDVMIGDATLFNRADMIEDAWRVVEPALQAFRQGEPVRYPSGGDGPREGDALIARNSAEDNGRTWRPLSRNEEPGGPAVANG